MHLDTLGEETSSIFLLHTRNHHAAPTSLPVNRRGHLASGSELEAVDHSEDFVEVSSCGGWVQERLGVMVGSGNYCTQEEGG